MGVLDDGFEAVLGGGRVAARFAAEMDGDSGAGGEVVRAIDPGFDGAFASDIGGLEGNGRVVGAVEALRPFGTEAKIPGAVIADDEQ